jgi:hypothetical protein
MSAVTSRQDDDMQVLPPSPLHDEEEPLLGGNGATRPDHGTLSRDCDGQEEDGEGSAVPDEPTTAKVMIIMWSMWMGSFWAAMGEFVKFTHHHCFFCYMPNHHSFFHYMPNHHSFFHYMPNHHSFFITCQKKEKRKDL